MAAEGVQRPAKADEVAREQFCSLVNELIEGMLAVSPRLTPEDRSRLIIDPYPVHSNLLAVTLHC